MNAFRATARELVRAYHDEQQDVAETELHAALGLSTERAAVATSYDAGLEEAHAGESVVYLGTPYPVCRALFRAVTLGKGDLVVDLGCGTGRLLLYGALCTPARFLGVELIPERCATAQRAVARLSLDQVEVVEGNALELDLREGTVFYLFRPFSSETESAMVSRLHDEAGRRPITVAANRLLPTLFDDELFDCSVLGDLRIYRSGYR